MNDFDWDDIEPISLEELESIEQDYHVKQQATQKAQEIIKDSVGIALQEILSIATRNWAVRGPAKKSASNYDVIFFPDHRNEYISKENESLEHIVYPFNSFAKAAYFQQLLSRALRKHFKDLKDD